MAAASPSPTITAHAGKSHSLHRSHSRRTDKRSRRKAITKSLSVQATSTTELKTQAKRLFHHYDTMHTGKISADTMVTLLNDISQYAPNQLTPFAPDVISELVLSLADADGEISYSQFKAWWVEANKARHHQQQQFVPSSHATPPDKDQSAPCCAPSEQPPPPLSPPIDDEFIPPPPPLPSIDVGVEAPPASLVVEELPPQEIDLQLTVTEETVVDQVYYQEEEEEEESAPPPPPPSPPPPPPPPE
jgi:hypothetical protein